MKRLTQSDRDWFLKFLQDQIQEEIFNEWRYKSEEQGNKVNKLKKIYNILRHEN